MDIKILGVRKLKERIDRGNPLWAATPKPRLTIIMNNLLKALSQHATQSGMITKLGLLQSGKLTFRCVIDRDTHCNILGKDTRVPTKFLSWEDPALWNSAIHCERGNTSWSIEANRCDPSKRSKTTAIYNWKRWNRIRIVSGIQIILKQGEWSSAEKTKTIFYACYRRRRKTFHDIGNVHVCNNGISSIHGKELLEQLSFHPEYKRPHIGTNVRHICKIGVWTRWDLWIGNNWLGKSFTEIYLSLIVDERVINLQRTKVYVFSDSVLCLGKIYKNPQSNGAWEDRLGWF